LSEAESGTNPVSRFGPVCDGRETVATTIPTRQLRRPTVGRARGVARETATVRVAFAVIALHLVDDAFVHPESGTAMGDHLASGLVPTAVAVLLATAYPRLGNGWQAATAIGSGVLALVGGVGISARHVVIDRLAGDDLTGILAGLAGIMLIGCGIHAAGCAWRAQSRRVTPARRALRRLAVALAVLLGVVFVVFRRRSRSLRRTRPGRRWRPLISDARPNG
jgi:di/tricarboxylate transporter